MEEELYQLLEEGKKRGYDRAKLEQLTEFYYKQQDSLQLKPQSQQKEPDWRDYYRSENADSITKPKSEATATPLTALGTMFYDQFANQFPKTAAIEEISNQSKSDFNSDLIKKYVKEVHNGIFPKGKFINMSKGWGEKPSSDDIWAPKDQEALSELINYAGGEEIYNQRKNLFDENRKFQIKRYERERDTQQKESDELTSWIPKTFEAAKEQGTVGAFAENIAGNVGQTLAHAITSIPTLGTSMYHIERQNAYDEMVDAISEYTDKSREEVTEQRLDVKAHEYADVVGGINMALENVGMLVGAGATFGRTFIKRFAKDAIKDKAKTEILKNMTLKGVAGATAVATIAEGSTEAMQEAVTMFATEKSKGLSDEEAYQNVIKAYPRILESFWAGSTGGGVLGGAGAFSQYARQNPESNIKIDEANKQLAVESAKAENKVIEEKVKIKEASDKADAAITTAINPETNTGTEQDIDDEAESIQALAIKAVEEEEQAKLEKIKQKTEKLKQKAVDEALVKGEKETKLEEVEIEIPQFDDKGDPIESRKEPRLRYKDEAGEALIGVDGETATISEIYAAKDEEGNVKKGGNLYGKVVQALKDKGIKKLVVNFPTEGSTGALNSLIKKNVLFPINDSESSFTIEDPEKNYWVVPTNKEGTEFNVVDKKPRRKEVPEPVKGRWNAEVQKRNLISTNLEVKAEQAAKNEQKSTEVKATKPEGAKKAESKKTIQQKKVKKVKPQAKLKTEEGTINLETGEVTIPTQTKKRGRSAKAVQAQPESGVPSKREVEIKKSPVKNADAVKAEQNKFNTMLVNRTNTNKEPRPSKRLASLITMRDSISKARFPEAHEEISTRLENEISKLEQEINNKKEGRAKKEAVRAEKEAKGELQPRKTEEQKEKARAEKEVKSKKLEELNEQKKAITDKYAEIRDKQGNVLNKAIPQFTTLSEKLDQLNSEILGIQKRVGIDPKTGAFKKGKPSDIVLDKLDRLQAERDAIKFEKETSGDKKIDLWEATDVQKIKELNKQIAALDGKSEAAERQVIVDDLVEEGMDLEDAEDLADAEDISNVRLSEREKKAVSEAKKRFKNFTKVDTVEVKSEALEKAHKSFAPLINKIFNLVELVTKFAGHEIVFYKADPKSKKDLGGFVAYSQGKIQIVLSREENYDKKDPSYRYDLVLVHELVHLLEFNLSILETGARNRFEITLSNLSKELQKIFEHLSSRVSSDIRKIFIKLAESKELTTNERVLYLLYEEASEYTGDPESHPIYGLNNPSEMLAEAVTNTKFAAVLNYIDAKNVTGNKASKNSVFKNVIKVLSDILNLGMAIIKELIGGKKLKQNIGKFNEKSYLAEIFNTIDNEISFIEDLVKAGELEGHIKELHDAYGDIYDPNVTDLGNGEFVVTNAKKKGKSTNSKLIDKLYKKALGEGITSKNVSKFIKEMGRTLGVELPSSVKAGLTKRIKNREYKLNIIKNADKIMDDLNNSWEASFEGDYHKLVSRFKDVEKPTEKSSEAEINAYAKAVLALFSGDYNEIRKAKVLTYITKKNSEKAFQEIGEFKGKFKQLKEWFTAFMNLPGIIRSMSKFQNEAEYTLLKNLIDPLTSASVKAHTERDRVMDQLNELASKNKMTEKNFQNVSLYASLMREHNNTTLEERFEMAMQNMDNMIKGKEANMKQLDHLNMEDILDAKNRLSDIYNKIKNGQESLSESERKYYDMSRLFLTDMEEVVKQNAIISFGKKTFKVDKNFFPEKVLGSVGTNLKEGKEVPTSSSLEDVFLGGTDFQASHVSETGHHEEKIGSKYVFYDINAHSVLGRYFYQTAWNNEAAMSVKLINNIISSNGKELAGIIGEKNRNILLESLKRAVQRGNGVYMDLDSFGEGFLAVRNNLTQMKLATSGQFFKQYVSMLPATMALVGADNMVKASEALLKLSNMPDNQKKSFDNLMRQNGIELGMRDYFWESWENPSDISKRDGTIKAWEKKQAEKTSKLYAKPLTKGDKWSAQLTFLGAIAKHGGEPSTPWTWTDKQISLATADMRSLQNVSTNLYAPKWVDVRSQKELILKTMLFSFRSFAMNASTMALAAMPHLATSKTAREVFMSQAISAVAFESMSWAVRGMYAAAGGLLLGKTAEQILKGGDDEEGELPLWLQWLARGIYSLTLGWLPSIGDATAKFGLNTVGMAVVNRGREKDERLKGPFYTGRSIEKDIAGNALGPMSSGAIGFGNAVYNMANNYTDEKDILSGKVADDLLKLTPEVLSILPFTRLMPWGDIRSVYNAGIAPELKKQKENSTTKGRRVIKRRVIKKKR